MANRKKILITGPKSGLGRYIYETFPGSVGLTRKNRDAILGREDEYDLIIHSAFNTKNAGRNKVDDYFKFVDDNILLTNELVSLNHKKFIYISSIAVYDDVITPYSQTKMFSESIVQKKSNNPLIVRCSSLLGRHMRPNTITKLIQENNPKITLSKDSTYNFIRHKDVTDFILKSYESNISGVFDFVASDYLNLKDIAEHLSANADFGEYTFKTNKISNQALASTFPEFDKSSWDALNEFIKEL